MKKRLIFVVLCVLALGCLRANVDASAEPPNVYMQPNGKFKVAFEPEETQSADSCFLLDAGHSVTITAVYTPPSADVEFGLLDPEGYFHPLSGTGGAFRETIVVNAPGYYTLVVRNNASFAVNVTGFISAKMPVELLES